MAFDHGRGLGKVYLPKTGRSQKPCVRISSAGVCCSRRKPPSATSSRSLFGADPLAGWEAVEADSFERARFVLQMEPCDALVLDAGLYRRGDAGSLTWLAGQDRAPLFLAEQDPDILLDALRHGAGHWLPRELALVRRTFWGPACGRRPGSATCSGGPRPRGRAPG